MSEELSDVTLIPEDDRELWVALDQAEKDHAAAEELEWVRWNRLYDLRKAWDERKSKKKIKRFPPFYP